MITPHPNQPISISGQYFQFVPILDLPNIPYCEIGRKAQVFKIIRKDGQLFALKVFFPYFRNSRILEINNLLLNYPKLSGLDVENRIVITQINNKKLIEQFPDFEYAILMPWILKKSWSSIFMSKKGISLSKSFVLAINFCKVILALEQKGLAHTDLSGTNVFFFLSHLHSKTLPSGS